MESFESESSYCHTHTCEYFSEQTHPNTCRQMPCRINDMRTGGKWVAAMLLPRRRPCLMRFSSLQTTSVPRYLRSRTVIVNIVMVGRHNYSEFGPNTFGTIRLPPQFIFINRVHSQVAFILTGVFQIHAGIRVRIRSVFGNQ